MKYSMSFHDQFRTEFQNALDALSDGGALELWPHKFPNREFPGPVVIKHPITLDGQGATVWALKGPVLTIQSGGVTLRNIKIEVTGESGSGRTEDECAILNQYRQVVVLENVEVRGTVIGLPEEEGEWQYPHSLRIEQLVGKLAKGVEHDLTMRVVVPVTCRIQSDISGLSVEPPSLRRGANDIRIHIEPLPQDTLLNGSISLSTASLTRRIIASVHVLSSQAEQTTPSVQGTGQLIWEPQSPTVVTSSTPYEPEVVVPPPGPHSPIISPSGETELPTYPRPTESPIMKTPKTPGRRVRPGGVGTAFQPNESQGEDQSEAPEQKVSALGDAFQPSPAKHSPSKEATQQEEASRVLPPSRRVKSQRISPLFGPKPDENDTEDHTEELKSNTSALDGASQEHSSRPDSATISSQQTVTQPPPSLSRRVKSPGISPLFEPKPNKSDTKDQTDEPESNESALDKASQERPKQHKRKLLRPDVISPLFDVNAKKKQSDEEE